MLKKKKNIKVVDEVKKKAIEDHAQHDKELRKIIRRSARELKKSMRKTARQLKKKGL